MESTHIVIIFFISLLLVMLPAIGMYKMFEKAGVPGWKALIPFYNTWVILKIAARPKHWFFWQFIPIVGWFITLGILIEFTKVFGRFKFYEHALTVFSLGLYFIYIGFNEKDKFVGPEAVRKYKKSTVHEWLDAGVFAVVAATLIRTFIFEAYVIPTGSMEKTLLVNDYLFVSKFTYGPRIPNTPLAIPFVHNTLPFGDIKSYTELIKIPYTRWFAKPIKRNDVVVFNLPVGDTVINKEEFQSKYPYYDVIRDVGNGNMDLGRKMIMEDPQAYPIVTRPVDKKDNYIKRCVAISGDTLLIKEGIVYINGVKNFVAPKSQISYEVETNGQNLDADVMKEEYNVDMENPEEFSILGTNKYMMLLTTDALDKISRNNFAKSIHPQLQNPEQIPPQSLGRVTWPYDTVHKWTLDFFGPLWIPKKGAAIRLTQENYSLYERVIRVYEGNKLENRNGRFFINDKETDQYVFKMNYYWMMGDNRHNSLDSRSWGLVPDDHIVGGAWFIWMSWDKGIRWRRLMNTIK